MKFPITLILSLMMAVSAAQNSETYSRCSHDHILDQLKISEAESYNNYRDAQQYAFEAIRDMEENRSTPSTNVCSDGIRIIPIYIHVLHNGGSLLATGNNNFTTAEIQSAIDQLNMQYQGTDTLLSRAQSEFLTVYGTNTCIQFCWNSNDVNRVNINAAPLSVVNSSGIIVSGQEDLLSAPVNHCQYLNLYVGPFGIGQFSGGGLFGAAFNIFFSKARVIIDDNVFVPNGAITSSLDNYGATTAHEVGHYLGLPHIWGNTNIPAGAMITPATYCGADDGFTDTPNQGRPSNPPGALGVPTGVQDEVIMQCGNSIMWSNFMDYTTPAWQVGFTKKQADFMRYFLDEADAWWSNILTCDTTGGYLEGESRCNPGTLSCNTPLIEPPSDTLRVCGTDTLNLNLYNHNWGYNSGISSTTEFTWRKESLSGEMVGFPAITIVTGNSPICAPDTISFFLNMKCSTSGAEQLGGKLTVISYLTPEELISKYLKDGDCEYGPQIEFSAEDLAAGCDQLIAFTPQSSPTFPTTVSGHIVYDVTFDDSVVGPCCNAPCSRVDSAAYRCEFNSADCPGVAFSGGFMNVLSPCPDYDFEEGFEYYENNLISLFDPNGYINDIYYYSDPEKSITFDEDEHYNYDGDGCNFAEDILIYTSLGCDNDLNGIPNGYIDLGTVTLSDPVPFPEEPHIEYSFNEDMDCVYEVVPACPLDDITPGIPVEVCGATELDDVTVSVLSFYDCEKEYTISKPDCPPCGPLPCPEFIVDGGQESVCSGSSLSDGLPPISGGEGNTAFGTAFWANGPLDVPGVQTFPVEPYDLPGNEGPVFWSNPETGSPEIQILFAYALCDDDGDPATPVVYQQIGGYEVIVEPVPDGEVVPVCVPGDSLNFYMEVTLNTNAQNNTFTASNSFNEDILNFSDPETQYFGPFPNGSSVAVDFTIDGGCTLKTDTFSVGCLSTSCVIPEISYTDTCIYTDEQILERWIIAEIDGNFTGPLIELTTNVNVDTAFVSFYQQSVAMGPFETSSGIEVTATDYTNRNCSTVTELVDNSCTVTSIGNRVAEGFTLFPNPSTGNVTIRCEQVGESEKLEYSVSNVLGQVIAGSMVRMENNEVNISLQQFENGLYFISLRLSEEKHWEVVKVIKE